MLLGWSWNWWLWKWRRWNPWNDASLLSWWWYHWNPWYHSSKCWPWCYPRICPTLQAPKTGTSTPSTRCWNWSNCFECLQLTSFAWFSQNWRLPRGKTNYFEVHINDKHVFRTTTPMQISRLVMSSMFGDGKLFGLSWIPLKWRFQTLETCFLWRIHQIVLQFQVWRRKIQFPTKPGRTKTWKYPIKNRSTIQWFWFWRGFPLLLRWSHSKTTSTRFQKIHGTG